MRKLLIILFLLGLFAPVYASAAGRVIKVLPFFLDLQGRNAKSPSLYDRDAYQAYLRLHTNEISAIRFDVQWKTVKNPAEKTAFRLELRGIGERGLPHLKTLETEVTPGIFSQWTNFMLSGDDYKKFGTVVAWRATLWRGGVQLGEQKSFLW